MSVIKADIVEYEYNDGVQGFKITNPPVDRVSQGDLDTYIDWGKWGFYLARFENDL